MDHPAGETGRLIELLRADDPRGRDRLIGHACDRLRGLTSRMLNGYPGVRRWEQTGDVLQNALLRLCRALEAVKPESPAHFYRLAALQIRRELIDLAQHYSGPRGLGANHDSGGAELASRRDAHGEPDSLDGWAAFHGAAGALPDEERELFGLLWYGGLTLDEAAAVLGASLSTTKRRWQAARLTLFRSLGGEPPGLTEGGA